MGQERGRGRRPGRPRVGDEVLGREGILGAAMRLVDEGGMAGLSMRRLAEELGVDPMAIYHYLPGKSAVVSGMVALVFAELGTVSEVDSGESWQERVRAWARGYAGVARAHPHLTLAIAVDVAAATEATLLASEPLFAALEAGGLGPGEIVRAAGVIVDYVNGWVLGATATGTAGDGTAGDGAGRGEVMRRVYGAIGDGDVDQGVEAGVEVILMGIERMVAG